jgi:3-oxo-5-alpha-steroid 4-dehydrogenase 1
MDEVDFHFYLTCFLWICGFSSFITLVWFLPAPYGRYSKATGWGMLVNAKIAWFFMESPNLWVSMICVVAAARSSKPHLHSLPNLVLLVLFCLHYVNRALIFPFRMRSSAPMPFSVMGLAWLFCVCNGYLQARWLTSLGPVYAMFGVSWQRDLRFALGVVIWVQGFLLNYQADAILRELRTGKAGEPRYKIPRGGLFEYVSGANFAAEIYEWTGFAVAAWSLPALTFAAFTFLNTAPRGYRHHLWYLKQFEDYPRSRKAVVPYIW